MTDKVPDTAKTPEYDLLAFEATEGKIKITHQGRDALEKTFGTESPVLGQTLLFHCILGLSESEQASGVYDFAAFHAAFVRDLAPRDAVEAALGVQLATTHSAMMRAAMRVANADMLNKFEAYNTAYNKLARTYTAQMEALRKHRNGGKQTVTMQHVNVGEGGQAIVGNVETGGRGNNEK